MWLTQQERATLAGLGVLLLAGLGLLWWQRQRPPLAIAGLSTDLHAAQWEERLATARTVDVNTATAAELERLPGVGPALAARIVEYRTAHGPFGAAEELSRVQGIGPKTLAAISDYIAANE